MPPINPPRTTAPAAPRRLWLACLAGMLAAATPAWAAESVTLQVMSIRATTKNATVAPELREIAEQLKKQFKFTGFSVAARKQATATMNSPTEVELPGNYKARCTPLKRSAEQIELRVEIFEKQRDEWKPKSRFVLRVAPGGTALQGGLSLDGGDTLILAISAR